MSVTISLKGVKELDGKLKKYKPEITAALLGAATTLKGKVAQYPPRKTLTRASVYGTSFVSPAQQRWFFAVGIHETPYRRSGKLGQMWTIKQSSSGFRVVIGNNTPYGVFVQDEEDQSLFHKEIGWKTYQDIAREYAPQIVETIRKALDMI